ncbi:thioesterase domain protein [Penicillium brevicompactum]|uniref:Thioesterase domain protein n=1 Tax=Penicillium brevicompactum TaxID=5074 RepID=A0A9W9QAC2_PENBR|nr:thioesterase domain protein [Penicillium brevicompactum]
MTRESFPDILSHAARIHSNRGIIAYPNGNVHDVPKRVSYEELHKLALGNGSLLRNLKGCYQGSIILLHFDNHLDNIIWMWSVLYAGCLPAMSTTLPRDSDACKRHLDHLNSLFENPLLLTKASIRPEFPQETSITILNVEDLKSHEQDLDKDSSCHPGSKISDNVLLMLTSGSTNLPKAVCLTHRQIMASLRGKCAMLPVESDRSFLNWIRLDHVGSLIEIHLHSLFTGTDQVHVQSTDVISDPSVFLRLIERHQVVRTFAPNFFLSELGKLLDSVAESSTRYDLSSLRYIVSGGEANVVQTCSRVSKLLEKYGTPPNVIIPGFGMTETCAGSIYSLSFPSHDIEQKYEFSSVGFCAPGIEMRVTASDDGLLAGPGEIGNLNVKGPIVFSSYHNNDLATKEAFSSDGWFKTGDTAFMDKSGSLVLVGRTKDIVSINGIKYQPQEVETILENTGIAGVTPGSLTCFAQRAPGAPTERLCVVYVPRYNPNDLKALYDTMNAIVQTVLVVTTSRPTVLPVQSIERTTLGKLPRSTIRSALENGQYHNEQVAHDDMVKKYQRLIYSTPNSDLERAILEEVTDTLDLPRGSIGVESNLFEIGLASITLIKLQRRLKTRLGLDKEITIADIMAHPTVHSLAKATQQPQIYVPVVPLQMRGEKTPLWLIHPAAGEAMVFLNLAKLITDRPVYSFRARGFFPDEPYFSSLEECIEIYCSALRKQQPKGPYAIAGYSYGGMLAFEIGKALERDGEQVQFLASVNRPPYVHPRLRAVQWSDCLLNLTYFIEVISEDVFRALLKELAGLPKEDVLARVLHSADSSRLFELALDGEKLKGWADVTLSLQNIARQYEPTGSVGHMDVFFCDPLEMVGATKEEWLKRLGQWQDFSREETKFYGLEGKHHNVFSRKHVQGLHKSLIEAMATRGV